MPRFHTLQTLATIRAAALGHRLGEFVADTGTSIVAECMSCERCVGIDGNGEYSGRAIRVECDGIPASSTTHYCECLACQIARIA